MPFNVNPYKNYFDIDPEYFSAVNEHVIRENPEVWKMFYPHETFIKLIKSTVSVLEKRQRLSIWVEGAYGTGKSHAVLTLKKLLDACEQDTDEYAKKYNIDNDLFNKLKRIKNSGKILTVHRYGSSSIHGDNDLVLAIQESIENAFQENGLEYNGTDTLKNSVIRYLSDEENKQSFNVYVKGSYADLFGGDDVNAIIEKLKTFTDLPLHTLMDKIFKVAKERQIKAFTLTTTDLAVWIKQVIKENDLKAIVFIWDEFTEYFYNNSRNLTGFQELCEISETDPFYFILVTHVSSGLFSDRDQDFIKLNGRFVNPHCLISLPENIAFELMGAAMRKKEDPVIREEWDEISNDLYDRTRDSRKVVKTFARIDDKELRNIIPIHPYAALILKQISSAFDSNQRSMFDFIKNDRDDDIKGFQWFINTYGPEDDNPLLTIDMLWEFFYDRGKEFLAHDIRTVLDYYSRRSNQRLDNNEKRVLKTILLLQAISQHAGDSVDLFIPNEKNLNSAFEGTDLETSAFSCAEGLVREKVLFHKQLGGGKFQFNAYINEVSGAELDKFKEEIDRRTTSSFINEQLVGGGYVKDAIALTGALKLRYDLHYVASNDFDNELRLIRNKADVQGNKIPAVVCFAKDDKESVLIGKKIRDALKDDSYDVVIIDASTTPLGTDAYNQFRDEMAQSRYQQGKDNGLSTQYANNARDVLKKWRSRIASGEFKVYTKQNPSGQRTPTVQSLEEELKQINKAKYPDGLESWYNVVPTMFTATNLKQGVECGATQVTKQIYKSSNTATNLENALDGAWKEKEYWIKRPNLLVSRIKIYVDRVISDEFQKSGRVAIDTIYESLKVAPFGFMPCNLTAFILGFVLKEYIDSSFAWSDGLTNDQLNLDKLKEMISEIISLQITRNSRYKVKYIKAMSDEEKAFNELTSLAFGIPQNLCTSVEQTRERIRNKMKDLKFPIWTLKYVLSDSSIKCDASTISNLIDNYIGIANSHNIGGGKSDNDIAMLIGRTYLDNKDVAEDLKSIISVEKCTEGMKKYLETFEDGVLISLANEIEDGGQYINQIRFKFDADAANWVWNFDTAQQKIREVILEYKIVAESNKIISRSNSYLSCISEWCSKCEYFKMSFEAIKNYLDEATKLMAMLRDIKKTGTLVESKKKEFLDLITNYGSSYKSLYYNQVDLFKKAFEFYLEEFTDDEIQELYSRLPKNTFTEERDKYIRGILEPAIQQYKNSLGAARLRQLWKEKTQSDTPIKWSKAHRMSILYAVPEKEVSKARSAFATINSNHPDSNQIEKAIEYVESASYLTQLGEEDVLDKIFKTQVIKSYSVMLTDIDYVKRYLESHMTEEPYYWFGLPEIDRKIKQLAQAQYDRGGYNLALEKIDKMDVADVKQYLKDLIKDNITVGIEIINDN